MPKKAQNSEIRYVTLATLEDGHRWMLEETPQGYKPIKRVDTIIEGEVIKSTSRKIKEKPVIS